MNNSMAIDHANRDWIDDSDLVLPRHTEEFPRISNDYTSKNCKNKPWGSIKDPVYINPFLDENQLQFTEGQNYEKGVWYYTGYPMTDHHDMAGLPSLLRGISVVLGLEYRPTFWINIYNRVRLLDFSENTTNTNTMQSVRN
jgi:hypothetical protein